MNASRRQWGRADAILTDGVSDPHPDRPQHAVHQWALPPSLFPPQLEGARHHRRSAEMGGCLARGFLHSLHASR
ncbi:MAG: hypothetical protein ACTSRS_01105 [Candidatus Helarchaeota archaeon]